MFCWDGLDVRYVQIIKPVINRGCECTVMRMQSIALLFDSCNFLVRGRRSPPAIMIWLANSLTLYGMMGSLGQPGQEPNRRNAFRVMNEAAFAAILQLPRVLSRAIGLEVFTWQCPIPDRLVVGYAMLYVSKCTLELFSMYIASQALKSDGYSII